MSNSQPTPGSFAYPISSSYPTFSAEPSNTQATAGGGSSSSATQSTSNTQQSRQAAEDARKDRTLAEFMLMLDEYEPLVSFSMPYIKECPLISLSPDTKRSDRILPSTRWIRMR